MVNIPIIKFSIFISNNDDNSPWVILNDLGGAFVMGAVGGGIWHSVKGAKNSPKVKKKKKRKI